MIEKTIFDLSNEELLEKFNNEFKSKYLESNYSEENWKKLNDIYNEAKLKLEQTNFAISTYNEAMYNLSLVESKKKEKAGTHFLNSLGVFFTKVGSGIATVYKSISFIFSIPALTFSSIVLTLFIHLFLGIFLYAILPNFINDFMVKSILAGIIFIVLKLILIFGMDDNILFDYKKYFTKFIITIPFYSMVFLIFNNIQSNASLEKYLPFFYPHMWLSIFTNEYVFSPMIALLINCLIPIGLFMLIKKRNE